MIFGHNSRVQNTQTTDILELSVPEFSTTCLSTILAAKYETLFVL